MTLNEQCLKSVDNKVIKIDIDINELKIALEEKAIMAEPLSRAVENANKIMVVSTALINDEVYNYISNVCGDKLKTIVGKDIPEQYKDKVLNIDYHKIEDFEFFGANAGRSPILFHKSIYDHDLIITVSGTYFNPLGGYASPMTTLFTSLSAAKSTASVLQNALYDSVNRMLDLSSGTTIRNPIFKSMREGIITAGRVMDHFAINITYDYTYADIRGQIFAGDLLLSQIEAQNIITKRYMKEGNNVGLDGLRIEINSYKNIIYLISIIEVVCRRIKVGGRLLVVVNDLDSFGNEVFHKILNETSLTDIINNMTEYNYVESFFAYILKYYTSLFNIAITSNDSINKYMIQAGLNPIEDKEYDNFLKNCSLKETVINVGN